MNNADMPAMPNDIDAQTFGDLYSSDFKELERYRSGLTKREMMAMHIFCSMNSAPAEKFKFNSASATAEWAVKSAEALIVELERTCQKP